MNERTARIAMGSGLLVVGIYLSISVYNALEILLYVAAALLGLAGLVMVPVLLLRRKPRADVLTAAGVGVGGIAMAVHDLVPGGIVLHILAAAVAIIGGVIVLVRGIRMPRNRSTKTGAP